MILELSTPQNTPKQQWYSNQAKEKSIELTTNYRKMSTATLILAETKNQTKQDIGFNCVGSCAILTTYALFSDCILCIEIVCQLLFLRVGLLVLLFACRVFCVSLFVCVRLRECITEAESEWVKLSRREE